MLGSKRFKQILDGLATQNSTSVFKTLGSEYKITADSDLISALYNNKNVKKSDLSKRVVEHIGAVNGLVSQSDEKAIIKRPILQKHFKADRFTKHTSKLANNIVADIKLAKKDFNLHCTLYDNISVFFIEHLMGVRLLEHQKKYIKDVGLFHNDKGFDTPLAKLIFINFFSFIPRFVKVFFDGDIKERHKKLDVISKYVIEECERDPRGCLSDLERAVEQGKLTRQDVIGECKMLLINASSLSASVAWAVYCVAKHTEHIEKMIYSSSYTRMVFMEVLRMYPPFHILSYQQKSKCPFHFGSQNTIVSVSAAHRQADNWKDPDVFDPSRFEKGLAKIKKGSYIPFGGGSRACPGSGVAMLIGPVLLRNIFACFRVVVNSEPVVKRRVELLPISNKLDLSFFDLTTLNLSNK